MSRGKLIATIVAVLLSVVFLWMAFRLIELDRLWQTFRSINWLYSLPFVAVTWGTFWWRAIRWRRLLSPGHQLTTNAAWGPMMVGFAFNSIFPLRLGEIARPLALTKSARVPFPTALSTVGIERIFDATALLAFFVVCARFLAIEEPITLGYGETTLTITPELIGALVRNITIVAAVLLAGSAAMLSQRVRQLALRVIRWMPLVPHALRERIAGLFESFASGFDALRRPALVSLIVVDTFIVWFFTGVSIWVMALGFPELDLSLMQAMTFLVITCLVISLPAAPGFWGPYEIGGMFALLLMGATADESLALGFTLVVHFLQWALVTVIGLYYAGRIHVSVGEVSRAAETVS